MLRGVTAPCCEESRRDEGRNEDWDMDGGGAVPERWRAGGSDFGCDSGSGFEFGFDFALVLGFTSDTSELSLSSSLEQGTYLSSEVSRSAKKALGMGRLAAMQQHGVSFLFSIQTERDESKSGSGMG